MSLLPSELILNDDGSIYHLNLLPQDISDTIITVGDPDRVEFITKYFDSVEISKRKREFFTQTGFYQGKRITVISTGIGTDNIDIVLNELDALVNIDFDTRQVKQKLSSLNIIRIGTSGSLQGEIPVDSLLISHYAIGFDRLLHYYNYDSTKYMELSSAIREHLGEDNPLSDHYVSAGSSELIEKFSSPDTVNGITLTNVGFYGPQGRILRLKLKDERLNDKLANFEFENQKFTNMEMETAGIYGLSELLGHHAISLNAIIANRATGKFSKNPNKTIDSLIRYTLKKLTS